MVDTREKIISYRHAEWLGDAKHVTLERCLRDTHSNLKTIEDRTVKTTADQFIRCADFDVTATSGVLLHITADTPGEPASIVPTPEDGDTSIEVSTADPPDKAEFMDGDAFIYVVGDHVCICSTLLRDRLLQSFFFALFLKAKIRADSNKFELFKIASIDKIKLIHSQEIKEVEIRASAFKASQMYSRRQKHAANLAGGFARLYRIFVGASANDVTNDSLRVQLVLKTDQRSSKHIALGEKRIETIAEDLLKNQEDGDDFVIVTKSGQRITQSEIFLKTKVILDKKGKSVDKGKAFKALKVFYGELNAAGIFEA
ncbi:MAG TPA: hypothetical protein VGH40_05350 [Roseiarcus sp.]|jgi:hypothetical protein